MFLEIYFTLILIIIKRSRKFILGTFIKENDKI